MAATEEIFKKKSTVWIFILSLTFLSSYVILAESRICCVLWFFFFVCVVCVLLPTCTIITPDLCTHSEPKGNVTNPWIKNTLSLSLTPPLSWKTNSRPWYVAPDDLCTGVGFSPGSAQVQQGPGRGSQHVMASWNHPLRLHSVASGVRTEKNKLW